MRAGHSRTGHKRYTSRWFQSSGRSLDLDGVPERLALSVAMRWRVMAEDQAVRVAGDLDAVRWYPLFRSVATHGGPIEALMLTIAVVLLCCTCSVSPATADAYRQALSLPWVEAPGSELLESVDAGIAAKDVRDLRYIDIDNGVAAEYHGVAKLLNQTSVLDLLDNYIINIPPSARFLSYDELFLAIHVLSREPDTLQRYESTIADFELGVMIAAHGAVTNLANADVASAMLHDAFFDVFDRCGRDSPWPQAELHVMGVSQAGDYPGQLVTRNFGMSYFDYRQLLHLCARYAATYPTLDPAVRDELLAPQRAHFARAVLNSVDKQLPPLVVPAEYEEQIDDLRRHGW